MRDQTASSTKQQQSAVPESTIEASVQVASKLLKRGTILPTQFAFLSTLDVAKMDVMTRTLEAVSKSLEETPQILQDTVHALFQANGFASPIVATTTPSPVTTIPSPTPTENDSTSNEQEDSQRTESQSNAKQVADQEVLEIIVLCIDVSGSMRTPFEVDNDHRTKDRTRLDGVKQMFYGFRDQTASFENGHRHRLGLLSYDHNVTVHTTPTEKLDVFEEVIDDLEIGGSTAIYEAIVEACQILATEGQKHQNADLRVICLSDGQNNCHKITADDAIQALSGTGAVCDCLIVGDRADEDLRKLVTATEGECFEIQGLADAYECLESPAIISLHSRRNGAPRPDRSRFIKRGPIELKKVKVAKTKRGPMVVAKTNPTTPLLYRPLSQHCPTTTATKGSQKRIAKELAQLHNTITMETTTSKRVVFAGVGGNGDLEKLKVALLPTKGYYAGRICSVDMTIPSAYPFSPPTVHFNESMFHYAINTNGGVCLPVLQQEWSPNKTIDIVITTLLSLIEEPEKLDPNCNMALRSMLSEMSRVNPEEYKNKSLAHAEQHLKKVPILNDGEVMDLSLHTLINC